MYPIRKHVLYGQDHWTVFNPNTQEELGGFWDEASATKYAIRRYECWPEYFSPEAILAYCLAKETIEYLINNNI